MLKKASIPVLFSLASTLSLAAEPGFGPGPGALDLSGESAVNRRPEFEPGFDEPRFLPQVLPEPMPPDAVDHAVEKAHGPTVTLQKVLLLGSTVLDPEAVEAVVSPYLNRPLTPEDLQSIRQQLTLLYVSRGYVNSGVILPDQVVTNQTLLYQAIEGALTAIDVRGNQEVPSEYISAQMYSEIEQPLSLESVQEGIRKLESDPLLNRINGQLVPGVRPGEARLDLTVEERAPFEIIVGLDNHKSPAVGGEQASITLHHLNLTGRRDRIIAQASTSEGLQAGYIAYSLPVIYDRGQIGLYYAQDVSEVVESPFDRLDITGKSENWGISFEYLLRDRLRHQLSAFMSLDHAASETELGGRPFSFSSGARRGESVSDSIQLGLESINRWSNQILAIRVSVRQGVDVWDATRIPANAPKQQPDTGEEIPESDFLVWLTQVQYVQRVGLFDSQAVISLTRQDSMDPLLSVDKFAIGGANSVRGFRENALVRDNGMIINAEWRIPLLTKSPSFRPWELNLVPFYDFGRSWDEDPNLSTHSGARLSSVGLGITARPYKGLQAELFYGHQLEDDSYEQSKDWDLQDEGIHFALSYIWTP